MSIERAILKFQSRPGTYLLIPCVAAAVGWLTNWLAVQMIFYPIQFRGIPIYQAPEVPLGLIGWQGIVPCKTRPMASAMVHMVTSQLLTVKDAFSRLDPKQVATILAPEIPQVTVGILQDIFPLKWMASIPSTVTNGLDGVSQSILAHFNRKFLIQLTQSMQENIDSIFNLQNCVVTQMLQDRTMLGQLFQKCGRAELDFLTDSGLWFGFFLGIIQMVVALFWDNPWSLSIGGGIVGLATNWLALKWIFEPVDPFKIGPITLQGQFLRRQKEVAKEFSSFFANKILTSEQLWKSVLTDPSTKPTFVALFMEQFTRFINKVTLGFHWSIEPGTLKAATERAIVKLPDHLPVLYPYMDQALGLQKTLRVKMEQMTSRQFERVLHPIFEEDELTLILAGAVLGFLAGLVQQGLETGAIHIPNVWKPLSAGVVCLCRGPRRQCIAFVEKVKKTGRLGINRIKMRLRLSQDAGEGRNDETEQSSTIKPNDKKS